MRYCFLVFLLACGGKKLGLGEACQAKSDCAGATVVCSAGVCTAQAPCTTNNDCDVNSSCVSSFCVANGPGGGSGPSGPGTATAPPTANAGADKTAAAGQWIELDGSASSDGAGRVLTYAWTQTAGATVAINAASANVASAQVPSAGTYTFTLTVTAGGQTATDDVQVTVAAYAGTAVQPSLESLRGQLALPGTAYDVAVYQDSYAYVADLTSGVRVVDVHDLQAMSLVKTMALPGNTQCVRVDGNYLYTASVGAGVRIFDLSSDPANPAALGTFAPSGASGYTTKVIANGNTLYVLDGYNGLFVVNTTNKSAPVQQANHRLAGSFWRSMALDGNTLVAVRSPVSGNAFDKFTLTGLPSSPVFGAPVTYPLASLALDVAVSGTTAWAAESSLSLIEKFDLTKVAGTAGTTFNFANLGGGGIAMYQGIPMVTTGAGLVGIDFTRSDPIAARYPMDQEVNAVTFSGPRAYVGATEGLFVLNLAGLVVPPAVAVDKRRHSATAVGVFADEAYVFSIGPSGSFVDAYDVSSRSADFTGGTKLVPAFINDVLIDDAHLYYSDDNGITPVTATDPAHATTGTSVGAYFNSLTQVGSHILTNDDDDYVHVIDVSTPSVANDLGNATMPVAGERKGIGSTLFAVGAAATSGASATGFAIWSPNNTGLLYTQTAFLDTPGEALDVAASDTVAYVADGSHGLAIVDYASPSTLTFRGSYSTTGKGTLVSANGPTVVVHDTVLGLSLIDVSDKARPRLMSFVDAELGRFAVRDGVAYVAVDNAGLYTYDLVTHGTLTLQPGSTLARGGMATYTYVWDDAFPASDEVVLCRASGGACVLTGVDQAAHTATLQWTLPSAAGDYEVSVTSGNALRGEVRRATLHLP